MRAVRLTRDGLKFDALAAEPVPSNEETMVRVLRAGICETDLQLVQGYMGFEGILGHEFVGIAQSGPYAGRRVVGEINCSCRCCDTCQRGFPTHCPNRTVLGILKHDGAFADALVLPQTNLHLVPDTVPTDAAVFTEPLAAAFQIPAQLPFRGNERIVVLGDGRLGNLYAQVLKTLGCRATVLGRHAEKLAILDRLGISTGLVDDAPFAAHGADVVVDCTGNSTGLETALKLVRPRGTIVLKTTIAGSHTLALAAVVIDEVTIIGSRCGPFEPALRALAERRIDVEPLIAATFPINDALAAFEAAARPGVLKVLLRMDGE